MPPADDRRPAPAGPSGRRTAVVALVVGFLLVNLTLLLTLGVRVRGDGGQYVAGADALLRGEQPAANIRNRLGYIALVAVSRWLGDGFASVVAVQLAAAAGSAVVLYRLGSALGGRTAGLVAAGLTALNPDIARWHVYVLTDSLYISAVPVAVWLVWSAVGRGWRGYAAAGLALAVAAALRPNGWLLVVVAGCYWWLRRPARPLVRWGVPAAVVTVALVAVGGLVATRPDLLPYKFNDLFRRGEVVGDYPEGRLAMPADPVGADQPGVAGLAGYLTRHPVACAELSLARVGTELAHVRPYHPWYLNAAVVGILAPQYLLATVGVYAHRRHPLTGLLLAVVAGHLAVQAVCYADWSGRFLLYILPLVGVLAGSGAAVVAGWLGDRRSA
jgi:hypothetical protein